MVRVLLVDDHAIVREGFKRLFENTEGYEVLAEASTVADAVAAARAHSPDIAVLDLSLSAGNSGLTLLGQLAAVVPDVRRVVLSMHDDPGLVLRALDLGAHGYVTKAAAVDELVGVLDRVMQGEVVLSSDLSATVHRPVASRLTPREAETLRGLLSDLPPKAIASELGISVKTLYRHRANLMEKLGARTVGELARIARERGLLAMWGH
ncbi:response regulator transcription factor [Lysobacter sp. S4-A87]|uniref:response regulator transcription factor n=1 Tax=Lysobacter sp. S4-A87 TaxID=2925843 RepID=UPI001F538EC9|nr:response regulator transcription factor [Lysobacter sp. S4-A87]UNK49669.1 response regulator transcription factor [Lysobacter sp. S4-A87]